MVSGVVPFTSIGQTSLAGLSQSFSAPYSSIGRSGLARLSQSFAVPGGGQPNASSVLDQLISDDQSKAAAYGAANAAVTGFTVTLQSILAAPLASPQSLPPPFAVPPPPPTTPARGVAFAPTANPVAALSVTSSLPLVASASAAPSVTKPSFSLQVSQLAQAQTALSAAVADPNNTVIGSGTLTFTTGSYNATHNVFVAGPAPAVSVSVVNSSLNSIATAINASGAGVSAIVTQDAAGYHLQLTSSATGAANGFRVTVQDSDGGNTDLTGLSQLAYDPTKPVGAGQNLTLSTAAQDAVYTLNAHIASSPSNTVVNALPGITLTLYQTSPTVRYIPAPAAVTVKPSPSALSSAATTFVNAYNGLIGTLQSLVADKGPLPKDPTVAGLIAGLKGLATQEVSGIGTYTSLTRLGFSLQKDGTLSLDRGALQSAFNGNPTQAVAVFNKIAQNLSDFANVPIASQYYVSSTPLAGQPLADVVGNQLLTGGALVDAQQNLQRTLDILKPASAAQHTATNIATDQSAQQYARTQLLAIQEQNSAALLASTGTPNLAARRRLSLVV